MQHISEQGLALLKQFEGFSACAYVCPAGKNTIGYGHVIGEGEDFDGGVTEEEAEIILRQDVGSVERMVCQQVETVLSQSQFDAVVCLVYNIGCYAFEKSSLLKFLRQGDFADAAGQFERWSFADGKKLPGLLQRRSMERSLFLS